MWELDYKESWVPKNWCFWTAVLEKALESSLDCKEIQPVHPKGNQSWLFIGKTDAEAEIPILWPPDVKSWLVWKDTDAGKVWRQEEEGTTEDEMVGWHHQLNGHELSKLQELVMDRCLACCSSWESQKVRHNWATVLNWWIRIRGLWKLMRETKGKLGLILMGRAIVSKFRIQFSVDGQGCVPSLLIDLRPIW